jgi:putative hydrolase of the HAD superfamily
MAGALRAGGAVETLFLDAGGVVLHPNWMRVAETLGRHGIEIDGLALFAADLRAKHELDRPANARAVSDDARTALHFACVLKHAGLAHTEATDAALAEVRRFHAERNIWEWVPEDVPPALARLRGLGLRLVMVSNANGTLHAHLERLGIARHFDLILDSFLEGVEKPDPLIFRRALERSGADPTTTLHVGDLYHVDVMGARAAGIEAWLLDAADLYVDADCPRVRSLGELATKLGSADV